MRAYGLPRILDIEQPDNQSIKEFALKSSVGSLKGKNDEYRSIHKNKQSKASARRVMKKSVR